MTVEYERREAETRDGRVGYYEAGMGPRAVVLLHGWTRAPRVWWSVLAATPAGWRAIAIDYVVRSEPPRDGYNIPALAGRAAALLDALGLDRAAVAGHSMGGQVALEFALRYPARLDRLVLACTGADTPKQGTTGSAAVELLRQTGKTPETMRRILRGWFHDDPPAADMAAMLEDAMLWPEAALFGIRGSMEEHDYRPRLGAIAAPTLVVHAEHDYRPVAAAEAMARGVQQGRLVVIPGCGHTPTQETPAAFNQHFWRFLQEG
ncbi:MAG TPA: alpha/beta hydrolase [Chloroflexota bacterium]